MLASLVFMLNTTLANANLPGFGLKIQWLDVPAQALGLASQAELGFEDPSM
jgi:hypothetical protein